MSALPTLSTPAARDHAAPEPARARPTDGHLPYRRDIDGLRAVAVLAVVGFHAFPGLVRGGFAGVDVFFVISGYLITAIILRGLQGGTFSFATFYARRVRRIFPALLVVLAAVAVTGWFVLVARPYQELAAEIAAGTAFLSNVALWRSINYFTPAADTRPLLHLWSLAIEEQFYLLWPLLFWLAWRWRVRTRWVALAVCATSFAWNVARIGVDPVGTFFLPFSRLWELAAGGLLAEAEVSRARRDGAAAVATLGARAREVLAAVGALMLGLTMLALPRGAAFPGLLALLPVVGTCLLIGAGEGSWVNRVLLARGPMVWVGLISYPLYLWHWPLLAFTRLLNDGLMPSRIVRAGLVLASVALAWATYRFVEQTLRRRRPEARTTRALLLGMVGCLLIAGAIHQAGGVRSRAPNRNRQAVFLDAYAHLHREGLGAAYRVECDFYEWKQTTTRAAIDPACLARGDSATMLLWGDSHAQALSFGIRQALPPSVRLAQVATSGCPASLSTIRGGTLTARACARSNPFARDAIRRMKPDVVILAQAARHDTVDWQGLADSLHAWGANRVVLVGPLPLWWPSLPEQYVRHHWGTSATRVRAGLDTLVMANDRLLQQRYQAARGLEYVSLQRGLCDAAGCLAVLPVAGTDSTSLMAVDYGHLTETGSAYVGRQIIAPVLLGRR